jgi:hypothetical protein
MTIYTCVFPLKKERKQKENDDDEVLILIESKIEGTLMLNTLKWLDKEIILQ